MIYGSYQGSYSISEEPIQMIMEISIEGRCLPEEGLPVDCLESDNNHHRQIEIINPRLQPFYTPCRRLLKIPHRLLHICWIISIFIISIFRKSRIVSALVLFWNTPNNNHYLLLTHRTHPLLCQPFTNTVTMKNMLARQLVNLLSLFHIIVANRAELILATLACSRYLQLFVLLLIQSLRNLSHLLL